MDPFAVQQLLSLTRLSGGVDFISFVLKANSKKLIWFMSKSVLPMFSSRNFLVSGLTLRSLIHFVFIFYMVWGNILISFFTFSCAVFPVPLLRRMPFPNILIYFVLISILFLLNYIWLTVLCHFLLQSIVTQLYIYIHFFSYYLPSRSIPRYWI